MIDFEQNYIHVYIQMSKNIGCVNLEKLFSLFKLVVRLWELTAFNKSFGFQTIRAGLNYYRSFAKISLRNRSQASNTGPTAHC